MNLATQLRQEEGSVPHAYQDHLGFWTIGIGRLVDQRKPGSGLRPEEITFLLNNDIDDRIDALARRDVDNLTAAVRTLADAFSTVNLTLSEAKGGWKLMMLLRKRVMQPGPTLASLLKTSRRHLRPKGSTRLLTRCFAMTSGKTSLSSTQRNTAIRKCLVLTASRSRPWSKTHGQKKRFPLATATAFGMKSCLRSSSLRLNPTSCASSGRGAGINWPS